MKPLESRIIAEMIYKLPWTHQIKGNKAWFVTFQTIFVLAIAQVLARELRFDLVACKPPPPGNYLQAWQGEQRVETWAFFF